MYEIKVKLKNKFSTIFVNNNFKRLLNILVEKFNLNEIDRKIIIISDNLVCKFYKNFIKSEFFKINLKPIFYIVCYGERAKNFKNFKLICNFLAKNKVKCTDLIIAFGGGVVCDLAGFVSACYLRGLQLVLIPTTLLAMVDACLGGKTSINSKFGKNLIGCFKQPDLVLCNLNFIKTLPMREYFSAVAEIVKYAVLFSANFFNFLVNCNTVFSNSELQFVVIKCLKLKKEIVEIDEFDNLGKRIKLNFGHTIGHALENIYGYGNITHGEAVAAGMAFCVKNGEKLGWTKSGEFAKLKFILKKFNLLNNFKINHRKLFKICLNDKKNVSDGINLVLLKQIGSAYVKKVDLNNFLKFLNI